SFDHVAQIANASVKCLSPVLEIDGAHGLRRVGHDLHRPPLALGAPDVKSPGALRLPHSDNQKWVYAVSVGCIHDDLGDVAWRRWISRAIGHNGFGDSSRFNGAAIIWDVGRGGHGLCHGVIENGEVSVEFRERGRRTFSRGPLAPPLAQTSY